MGGDDNDYVYRRSKGRYELVKLRSEKSPIDSTINSRSPDITNSNDEADNWNKLVNLEQKLPTFEPTFDQKTPTTTDTFK